MRKKIGIRIVLAVLLICAVCFGYLGKSRNGDNTTVANAQLNEKAAASPTPTPMIISKDTTKELGTKENPFLILEIVPVESYALMGYFVSGQEPVAIKNVSSNDWCTLEKINAFGKSTVNNSTVYSNLDLFAKYCIGLAYSDEYMTPDTEENIQANVKQYQVRVVTVTPEQLNYSLDLIEQANLIAIIPSTYFNNNDFVNLFNTYRNTALFPNPSKENTTFLQNDLSWEATIRIFKKVAIGEDKVPLIYDKAYYEKRLEEKNKYCKPIKITRRYKNASYATTFDMNACINNVYKLYLMLQQMDPETFYEMYVKTNKIVSVAVEGVVDSYGKQLTTGAFLNENNQKETYWGKYTFIPFNVGADYYGVYNYCKANDIDYDMNGIRSHNIRNNVFSYNGDNTMTSDFATGNLWSNDRMTDAFTWLSERADGSSVTLSSIHPVDAIYYLLHAGQERGEVCDKAIHILELQPQNAYKTKESWTTYIKTIIPKFTGEITVDQMTTDEFVGKIVDLNATYDLIYIGSNTVNGITINTRPENYIYYHEGNRVRVTADLGSWDNRLLEKQNSSGYYTRYPGNDITRVKKEEILQYIEAGYPVLFSDGLLNGEKSEVDTTKVDTATNLYEIAKTYSAGNTIYFEKNKTKNKTFADALKKAKMALVLQSKPTVYDQSDESTYINANGQEKKLKYQFYIEDKDVDEKTTYTVQLYIDTNADGRFDEETELLNGLTILDAADGSKVNSSKLQCNHIYSLSRVIDEYVGVLPWKLEITANDDTGRRVIETDFCAVKSDKREVLQVLQITADKIYRANTVYLPTDDEIAKYNGTFEGIIKNNEGANLTSSEALVSKKFYQYTKDLQDFEVHFTRMSVTQFQHAIAEAGSTDYDTVLEPYNMLIIGFSDGYSDITSENALKAIENFIDAGKTTLFTHDTTSFVNASNFSSLSGKKTTWNWGYNINKYFRDKLGMDRFGVMEAYPRDQSGPVLTIDQLIASNKDIAFWNNTTQDCKITYATLMGYTYMTAYRFLYNANEKMYYTSKVTKVNEGQITKYPYEIPDNFSVATTHAQYYQLDMESDDIVVWYCLDGNVYAESPNNTRNNYYIYNRGNITYSGVGHTGNLTDTEVKLFVNTMIAAYNASAGPLKVMVTNDEATFDSNEDAYLYVNYDFADNTTAHGEEIYVNDGEVCKRIYFQLDEGSIVLNKKINVNVYKAGISNVTYQIWRKADNAKITQGTFDTGVEYYVYIPIGDLASDNGVQVTIDVEMSYGKNLSKKKTALRSVTIYRRGLFNLN
ncbi:MAG: DUF5057 domain-containing protein [Lachnospiraceae bacterium]|nr:DUF5057 domain-containing protein [Lachnospiraceae bacterium]